MCFIGHGIFGVITKEIWCNYFGVFGIGREMAYSLMPLVGWIDIGMGVMMLVYPIAALPAWLVFWGFITAMLRPLSGEPVAEWIERAGNYGAPLAFLCFTGPWSARQLFQRTGAKVVTDRQRLEATGWILRSVVYLLVAGHGWLNLIGKPGILLQYARLGFTAPSIVAAYVGWFEICLAFLVLFRPYRPLVLALFFWKAGSELFYPQFGWLEWIERGGSYGAILALWALSPFGTGKLRELATVLRHSLRRRHNLQ
ncbi:hypothetical protein FPE01S_18_00070 [Flavihumibacter petaseus NBRC 106054]|uniref:DoxX family protein n=2 Tax=Flavihumibacter TaxID=1004301 RepID=A0A0E9N7G2_9BACT|nr:hypothetical protein FPE01S_18_00070 [Flavihumibacter petaseus NBRC 106054]